MPVDYDTIREKNLKKYGTDIDRIGGMLLAERYDDRTHFIFEVLQNAEDALKRRGELPGKRSVAFSLTADALTISHYGKPFNEADVRGVCGIGESTKKLTDIGRFGIGFKSVYAFTDTPEIHSGEEHFAIDSYVWPRSVATKPLASEETQIHIPFKGSEESAKDEVLEGLQRIGPRTLLFLREIDEISWSVDGKAYGHYLRSNEKVPVSGARKVQIIGQSDAKTEVTEEWLVFSREVFHDEGSAGYVEIAFRLGSNNEGPSVQSVDDSKLVVFFPTVLSTYLGFLVQGPYRTTPSRDNVPQRDPWNQHLVNETAILLTNSLESLKQLGLLSVSALRCLPLDSSSFAEDSRLAPMFQAVKKALLNKRLLPAHNGGHIAGKNAKLARTADLRGLIGPEQLAGLFPGETNLGWLIDSITTNRTPDLHKYLREDLDITDVTTKWLVSRLTKEFLEAQPDEWIMRLYEFFNGQKSVLRSLPVPPPLVRLETGVHTVAFDGDTPQAYLPGKASTGFPTVKPSVCQSKEALEFLRSLGLREPDPVDYVIRNILPKYDKDLVLVSDDVYRDDLAQALNAYESASREQRQLLAGEISKVKFTIAVDAATGARQLVHPGDVYWPTERLKALFQGVSGVLLLDDNIVPGEAHNLLAAAGTPDRLARKRVERELTEKEKYLLRLKVSNGNCTRDHAVRDYTLMGLKDLLFKMASMPFDQASERAKLLWKALCEFQSYRGDSAFYGRYSWLYYSENHATFPANFVERLSGTKWVPDGNRQELQSPTNVAFADTWWEANPSLAEKVGFLPSEVDKLAKNESIDREALHYFIGFMKENSNITLTQIRELLPKKSEAANDGSNTGQLAGEQGAGSFGGNPTGSPSRPHPSIPPNPTGGGSRPDRISNKSGEQISQPRPSISITLRTSSDGSSGGGLGDGNQHNREVENAAIRLILEKETSLKRTKYGNHGFDLWEPGGNDKPVQLNEAEDEWKIEWELGPNPQPKRWIEVKSSEGALPSVTLSIKQFRYALERQCDYWLYVVENATTEGVGKISKIPNPAQRILNTIDDFNLSSAWIREHQSRDNPEEG